jgi:outer membrane protein assembly factor BamB
MARRSSTFAASSNGGPTVALDIGSGKRRWSSPVSSDSPSLVIGDVVIVIEAYRHLVALELTTGRTLWRLDVPATSISSFAPNTLLVMDATDSGQTVLTLYTF